MVSKLMTDCRYLIDTGLPTCLGHFAVKKIAVGESHAYLLQILREVCHLKKLQLTKKKFTLDSTARFVSLRDFTILISSRITMLG